MKICAACTLELPKERFSNQQWQRKLCQRRCTECITIERVAQLTAPECWICLGDEVDKQERLRRDCSCRGTNAGFVHLSCLVEYAKTKNQGWDEVGSRNMRQLKKPWVECPNCKQVYQITLCVSFVEREHPNDKYKHVEALYRKLLSLCGSLKIDKAKEVATIILVLIGQMKVETPMLPKRCMLVEAFTYNKLGAIALSEGKEDSAKEALIHFEKYLELSTAIDHDAGIANTEYRIALVKSKCERCDVRHNEVLLKKSRDLYDLYVTRYGEEDACTINQGMNLAIVLYNANRVIEAERLLTRVVTVCERVNGPQHENTKCAKQLLQKINAGQAD